MTSPRDTGGFAAFVRAFVNAFQRAQGERRTPRGSRQQPQRTQQQSPHSSSAQAETQRTPAETHHSPGQTGPAATRDLNAAEIRALRPCYAPEPDGAPDPGEIVWTWVPYEEHDGRGKDRPVLIVARIDATTTAACALSTKAHRGFVSVGTGGWDSQGRESFVSPDRVLRISDAGVRREGNVLPAGDFARVIARLSDEHQLGA